MSDENENIFKYNNIDLATIVSVIIHTAVQQPEMGSTSIKCIYNTHYF